MKKSLFLCLAILALSALTGCQTFAQAMTEEPISTESANAETYGETTRPEDWSDDSHGDGAEPDYETVFPQDEVNRIDIEISPENWETLLTDMTDLMGEFGQGGGDAIRPGFQGNGEPPEGAEFPDKPPEGEFPQGNQRPGNGGGNLDFTSENPVWVTATVEFEGETWEYVGIRFKGNSSLRSAWSSGNLKLPFKLDFDQFEDEYPQIDDQRFYGFKQLSLASNFNDDSYLHEKVTADIFREFGVPSAHTAFYEVYVDYGEGPVYFGLYTMVEMVEDTVISQQFSSDTGNLYKPEGAGATFADGSFSEASFDKETNQDEDDYSDILALFDVLHSDTRLSDPAEWRSNLEAVFDVDTFLRWLAVNTVVQNWDTYGQMSHNYFLYTDPETGLITWIPWDNNHALTASGGMRATPSLSLDEVTEQWPLIRYLMDDPVYQAQYESYLSNVIETVFVPEEMAEIYQAYHNLIEESALAETPEATMLHSVQAFQNSVQVLINQVNERHTAVQQYLAQQ
jgi:spore coat protein CotH